MTARPILPKSSISLSGINQVQTVNIVQPFMTTVIDEITGEEQDNLSIMVAVPRIDLSTAENRLENIAAISGIVEEQYRRGVQSFTYEEYTAE